jgi:hypothetical protein
MMEIERLQARQGRDAKTKVAENAQREGRSLPVTPLQDCPTQQYKATAAASAALSPLRHNRQVPSQFVSERHVDSSRNDISADHDRAQWG